MRRNFQIAIGLLWLAPIIVYLQYRMVWDALPSSVATHFGANGQPNGWMSRETAMAFPLVVLVPVLLLATFLLGRIRTPDAGSWATLGVFYVVPAALIAVNQQILAFNLQGTPIHVVPIVGGVFAATVLCMLFFLGTKRGEALPHAEIVAEEVHGSRSWALSFLVPLVLFVPLILGLPDFTGRAVLTVVSLMMFFLGAATWSGFHYRFSHAGLEIRTMGLRLRSIPKEHIRDYRQEPWNWMGGYGIRGLGADRAYVWCNTGVRIHTFGGSVFLGHAEPQRLIRDLDVLTGTTR